jgi:hypothetical protein
MKKKMTVQVRRSKKVISVASLPANVKQIMKHLDKYRDGDIMPSRDVAAEMGLTHDRVMKASGHPALAPYKIKGGLSLEDGTRMGNANAWGNKATIKYIREEQNARKKEATTG